MGNETVMLLVEHVTFQYESEPFALIDDLSFDISPGEFVSLIGPSGCGKSTVFRLIARLLSPRSGRILVDGDDISGLGLYCGYMPQQDNLFPWRNVSANLRLPLEIRGTLSRGEMDRQVRDALTAVGLEDWGDKPVSALSGGMRQRASFARTTLTGCDLLLLDEPFSALDYLTRLDMREWLLSQWERDRKTVVFITHDVEEAIFLSGRILVAERSPIHTLTSVDVDLPWPRDITTLGRPEAIALKERLINMLRSDSADQ